MKEDINTTTPMELEDDSFALLPEEVMDEIDLHSSLMEAIILEPKYQPSLTLPQSTKGSGSEISLRMRNGSAHVLRCLKVWYDLPSETFFNAVNVMDRFLTRMRAQPKHLSCIAVSAFHLSCELLKSSFVSDSSSGFSVPDRSDLTNISQAKCGPGDVARMENIMMDKLDTDLNQAPITALTMLRLLHAAHATLAQPHLPSDHTRLPLLPLVHKLEIIACDTATTVYRPSELALTLLSLQLEEDMQNLTVHSAVINSLFNMCKMNEVRFKACMKVVTELIDQYETCQHSPHRQRLVWKLSNRTLRQLRPTDKYKDRMPTIDEKLPDVHPIIKARMESSDLSSDEEMDFDYDEEFPPLPPPASIRSPLKSVSSSPHKKQPNTFPYPKVNRKHGRFV